MINKRVLLRKSLGCAKNKVSITRTFTLISNSNRAWLHIDIAPKWTKQQCHRRVLCQWMANSNACTEPQNSRNTMTNGYFMHLRPHQTMTWTPRKTLDVNLYISFFWIQHRLVDWIQSCNGKKKKSWRARKTTSVTLDILKLARLNQSDEGSLKMRKRMSK